MTNTIKLRNIVLTGGGTPGHVTPNIALIEALQPQGCHIEYIGSTDGVEKKIISELNIPYHAIRCGKLRRYFSWQNFLDPFNVLIGLWQAFWLLRRLRPQVVFSKGGFVALPVVVAAHLNRIPVVAHESDMSPGLANRLSFPFVNRICVTFASAKEHFKQQNKVCVTGTPLRQALFHGDKQKGLEVCGFTTNKPCIMVMGGGQGSHAINQAVRHALSELTRQFNVIHLCGPKKVDLDLALHDGYCQFEYVSAELPDLFAASDLIVSRSGANSLSEILALAKPHVLIPLSKQASRGDQIQNASYFAKQGISVVLEEEKLDATSLVVAIERAWADRKAAEVKMHSLKIQSGTNNVLAVLEQIF